MISKLKSLYITFIDLDTQILYLKPKQGRAEIPLNLALTDYL